MKTALISHPDCLLHDIGHGIPEIPERMTVIEQAISSSDLMCQLQQYLAPLATRDQLLRVHDSEYIDYVFMSSPKTGIIPLDPDTWMNPYTLKAALHAAGAAILGVDLVMTDKNKAAFCNIRPPGHHAEKSTAMGFCIFNNVAVGVAHALEHYGIQRIAIIDFDAHHGNGLENIFFNNKKVLYCSSFEHPFYPFSGADTISDHIINIPLAAGSDGKDVRHKIKEYWYQRLLEFKPEMLFFSAGFDAFYRDVMSDLMFHIEDYAWMTRDIIKLTQGSTQNRIVSLLEGGYALDGLGDCVIAHLREIVEL